MRDYKEMEILDVYLNRQKDVCIRNDEIAPVLFKEYGVYHGLRDDEGQGVLTGLTNISRIVSYKKENGVRRPCEGQLWYRGYRVEDLIGNLRADEMGFEKIAYLLLMGQMPSKEEEEEFTALLASLRPLPVNFVRDVVMKAPTQDIMNAMTKSILTLASHDKKPGDQSLEASLLSSLQLIAQMPLLAVYSYNSYNYKRNDKTMFIHNPDPALSAAENILRLLRVDSSFTPLEAKVLDTALILHMEHGGGNNSTFTTRVVTSTGSDTYATIAAAMSSLKGPKHGGANIKVMEMMEDIRSQVADINDEDQVCDYLARILAGQAFDGKGLIYGIGHAVYTVSDPRERVFKKYVEQMAQEKDRMEDMRLYQIIEDHAPRMLMEKKGLQTPVCTNVDFYSGFVYDMLGIPRELYTAFFAIARIVGWSAHRIEELITSDKIIRPAYKSVMKECRDDQ